MKRQKGFTLTETLVVLAIVGILLGIAIPSYKYLTTSYRMSAEINSLSGDMQFARAEALKEGVSVSACVSNNGISCTGGNNWAVGWIVFQDPNANATVDVGERVLKVQNVFNGTTPDTFNTSTNVTSVTYNREGFASTTAGFVTTTVTLKDPTQNAAYTRCLQISAVGMLSAQTDVGNPTTC